MISLFILVALSSGGFFVFKSRERGEDQKNIITAVPKEKIEEKVLGVENQKLRIVVSNAGSNGYGSGGILSQALTEEPELDVDVFGYENNNVKVEIYKTDKNHLIKYLLHDKDGKQINGEKNTQEMRLIASFDQTIDNGNAKITLPDAGTGIWMTRVMVDDDIEDVFVVRSSFGAIVKNGDNEMIFWAQDFKSKRSLSGARIEVDSFLGKIKKMDSATTNFEGIAKTSIISEADAAFVEKNGELAIIPINLRSVGYSSYSTFKPKTINQSYFIFTDRPIYQPGDIVNFKAIIRNEDDVRYSVPRGEALVEISDSGSRDNNKIFSQRYLISENGTIAGNFALPKTAKTGDYYVRVKVSKEQAANENGFDFYYSNSAGFQVEHYQKPEYDISVDADRNEIISGEDLVFKISGNYFSGQPLAGKKVKYRVYSSKYDSYDYFSDYEKYKDVKDFRYYRWYGGGTISEGEASLNENGAVEVKLGSDIMSQRDGKYNDRLFTIETEFSDESEVPATDAKNFLAHAGAFSIFREDVNYGYRVGDQISFDLALVSHDNSSVFDIPLTAAIHRKTWRKVENSGEKYPNYVSEEEDLEPISIKTDSRGKTTLQFNPSKEGSYEVTIKGIDGRGNIIGKEFYAWVSDRDGFYWENKKENSGLTIQSDKDQYNPKETAQLTVSSNIPDRDIFLSMDRARVNRFLVVHLKGNSTKVGIPLVNTDTPNIFASVSSFSEKNLDSTDAEIKVSAEGKKINVSFTADKNTYNPEDQVVLNLKTADMSGNPISAETAVWLVDKAIFELANNNATGIFDRFWHERYDDTNENHSLMGIISEGAEKGGGGGGDGGRSIFKDTAYWNPSVKTDTNGLAKITFKLPDNLTTWVISGIAVTNDTRVGEGQKEIVATKDVVVRPVLPNILKIGDSVVVSALVHNFSDKNLNFNVTLEIDEAEIESPEQQAEIDSKSEKQVFWKINPQTENEKAKVTFSAVSENKEFSDVIMKEIPVRKFGFWETKADVANDENKTYSINLSKDSDKEKTSINFSITPTLFGTLPEAMKYLVDYPYGCVEQTTSRFVPAVIAKKNSDIFGESIADKNIDDIINKGIERLIELQGEDGGWGWYGKNSDPFVTAYVTEYLAEARNLGFSVDDAMFQRVKDFFESYSNDLNKMSKLEIGLIKKYENVAKVYALSILDPGNEKNKEQLADFNGFTPDMLSLAVMANVRNGFGDPRTNGLEQLLSMAKSEGNELFWDSGNKYYFGSKDASTALAVRAIIAAGQNRDAATKGIRFLSTHRKSNYWSNTFATANTIRAIVDFSKDDSGFNLEHVYSVILDGEKIKEGTISKFNQLDKISIPVLKIKESGSTLAIEKNGKGEIYSTLITKEFRTEKNSPAVSNGLTVERSYENITNPGQNLHVGDMVKVKIVVSGLATEREYAVIEDELPSGLTPVNRNLKNEQPIYSSYRNYNYYSADQEITENGIILTAYAMAPGTNLYLYEARVLSEGTFYVPPAKAELMYSPEVNGRSEAQRIVIDNNSFATKPDSASSQQYDHVKKYSTAIFFIVFIMTPIAIIGYVVFKRIKKRNEVSKSE